MNNNLSVYNQNPNICNYCKSPILAIEGQKLSQVQIKKFCSHSCAAKFHNISRKITANEKFEERAAAYAKNPNICENCHLPILVDKNQPIEKTFIKKFCNVQCAGAYRTKNRAKKCIICDKLLNLNLPSNKCSSCWSKARRYRVKLAIISYLGGSCQECGWQGHVTGFDVHHKLDEKKDFTISEAYYFNLKRIKDEVDKCILLCARCHRLEHRITMSEKFIEFVSSLPEIDFNNLQKQKKQNFCIDCGAIVIKKNSRCKPCYHQTRRKI